MSTYPSYKNIGISIIEGGLSFIVFNNTSTSDPKNKGNGVQIDPSAEEKKRLQELDMEKLRHLNNIMMQRKEDPPGLDKGDPNKD